MALKSFKDKTTAAIFLGLPARAIPGPLRKRALMKLQQLHAAGALDDLRIPPSNRLEALKGSRAGQHTIRINDQWRICFRWTGSDAEAVEIVDYD